MSPVSARRTSPRRKFTPKCTNKAKNSHHGKITPKITITLKLQTKNRWGCTFVTCKALLPPVENKGSYWLWRNLWTTLRCGRSLCWDQICTTYTGITWKFAPAGHLAPMRCWKCHNLQSGTHRSIFGYKLFWNNIHHIRSIHHTFTVCIFALLGDLIH